MYGPYEASCHCGAVRLRFFALDRPAATGCDCSICKRKHAGGVTVAADDLEVLKGETLRLYTFNTHVARHYFCGTCGIHTHHRRSSNPDEYRVNSGCIEMPSQAPPMPKVLEACG